MSHTSELRQYPSGKSYVAAAEQAIIAAGHFPVNTADFPAADQTPAQVCIDRVAECHVYVGLLGVRFGSPVRDRPDLSYPELELQIATERGLPRLMFVLNEAVPIELWDEHPARMAAFRRQVSASLTVQRFTKSDELRFLVQKSLLDLAASRALPKRQRTPTASFSVSYSHRDRRWLEQLLVHLKPLQRSGHLDVWEDSRIAPGEHWRDEIDAALKAATTALLLVSADFMASDFVHNQEIPQLLKAANDRGTIIMPVLGRPSRFSQDHVLGQFQAVNPPHQPLSKLPTYKREEFFVELADKLERALTSRQ